MIVQSTSADSDLAGTSRTRPPTQYADTCPSSQSTTARGPFSKRGSVAATVVVFAAAFFAPGRRDVAVGLVPLAALREGGFAAAGADGAGAASVVNVSGTTGSVTASVWGGGEARGEAFEQSGIGSALRRPRLGLAGLPVPYGFPAGSQNLGDLGLAQFGSLAQPLALSGRRQVVLGDLLQQRIPRH
ncbi:hypothetical protein QF037_009980 [Streptomyces canus]|nr:hypothetical protein [Streptomyces canus]